MDTEPPNDGLFLSPSHRAALDEGAIRLIDGCFEDLAEVDDPAWDFDQSYLASHLPRRYLPSYSPLLVRRFFVCVVTAVWKLAQRDPLPLGCVAEELAAWAVIKEAEGVLEERGEDADLSGFEDSVFADMDFLTLFDPAQDGLEDSEVGCYLGMGALGIDAWFEPFLNAGTAVHPYVLDGAEAEPGAGDEGGVA